VRPNEALRSVVAALVLGLLAQYLFVRERLGLDVPVAIGATVVLAWLSGHRQRGRADALLLLALIFGALCAVRAEVAVQTFDALAAATCVALWLVPLDQLGAALTNRAASTLRAALRAGRERVPSARRPLRYAAGSLLALPFLLVFTALFASADAVFDRGLRDVLELVWLRELFRDAPARAVVVILVAWGAAGAFATRRDARRAPVLRAASLLANDTAVALLIAIDALFAVFVWLQVAYLFGGRDTLNAGGLAYSAYARRGFFELVAVAAIVGGLLFTLGIVVAARGRAYALAALALIALTGVVLASAAYRMSLYQDAYGWTELRLYANALIALLAAALVLLAVATLTRDIATLPVRLAGAAAIVAIVVSVIGPARIVAETNIDRVLHPERLPADAFRGLDTAHLASLGDGAVPTIDAHLAELPPAPRIVLEIQLQRLAASARASEGWQSWNWDRARARDALARHEIR